MDGIHVDSGSDPNLNPMDIAIVGVEFGCRLQFFIWKPIFLFCFSVWLFSLLLVPLCVIV